MTPSADPPAHHSALCQLVDRDMAPDLEPTAAGPPRWHRVLANATDLPGAAAGKGAAPTGRGRRAYHRGRPAAADFLAWHRHEQLVRIGMERRGEYFRDSANLKQLPAVHHA